MLCQFSFQNFKSYRDETVFDLQATAIPEFKDNLIVKDKCSDLLPVSVIYGPNGGGKTNLIRALSCLITTVVRPIYDLGSTRKRVIMQQKVVAEPFLFDSESKDEPTEFEIFFRTEKYEYRYYLAVLKDEISAETLDRKTIGGKKPAHIFYRDGEELMNILVQEYRCSGGTETANPAAGNRCSETGIPHLVTSYLCEFTRLKLDLIHILPAWTCNYLGLSG